MERFLIVGAIALFALPAHAGQEWWQVRGCELSNDPRYVYCPPKDGAKRSDRAIEDYYPRNPVPLPGPQRRFRTDRLLEEFIDRDERPIAPPR